MKIYNPLRWHITKAGDLYFVRRWEVLGWCYIDADGADYKWSNEFRNKYCAFSSLDAARKALACQYERFVK